MPLNLMHTLSESACDEFPRSKMDFPDQRWITLSLMSILGRDFPTRSVQYKTVGAAAARAAKATNCNG